MNAKNVRKFWESEGKFGRSDGSGFGRDQESLLQRIENLKCEFDHLRVQNQALHVQLARFNQLRYLIRRILKIGWLALCQMRWRIQYAFCDNPWTDAGHYNATFKPYPVRILKPLNAERARVLHVIANFYTGGSARLVVDLVEHLGHKYEQEVVTRDLPETAGYVGLTIRHYKQLNSPRPLLPYLSEFRPDFVHIHFLGHHKTEYSEFDWQWYNQVFEAVQSYGCKIIENINIPVDPYISDAVSHYVYVSDFVREEFGTLNGQNLTIYPGSNFSLFSRKDSAIPDDCIGMVYRLESDKLNEQSIDTFIKAVQLRPGTKALIVGGGCYLKPYQEAVRRVGLEDAFTFTGYVSYNDLPQFYERLSVFVAPVHDESFGQVSPFAMNMSIPVVGYNVGALKEIIQDERLLVPVGDSDALANLVVGLLDDRERRLRIGSLNCQRAQKLFSVEAMCSSYESLYDRVMRSC